MNRYRKGFMICLSLLIFVSLTTISFAAETQVVNKDNWKTLKDLMPEQALEWVKSGDMVVKYGALNYDPAKVLPKWVVDSKKNNSGKFTLTEKNAIVEAATGKTPEFIEGLPFPDVTRDDPIGPAKVMWNTLYVRDCMGPLRNVIDFKFMGRKTGYERSIEVNWFSLPFDGYAPAKDWENPNNYEALSQILIIKPYDMAGTAMMTWRYRIEKEDMLFGYVPAIRRVRRTTPAGGSDALFGSDFARDDGAYGAYDGNVNNFNWKFMGEGEVIGAFLSPEVIKVKENEYGEWAFDLNEDDVVWSFENKKKDRSAAPWFVDSAIWSKRPVWIIEGTPKDKYYNYGKQIMYIDKEMNIAHWKVIYDRTGKYWKTQVIYWANGQDEKKTVNWLAMVIESQIDERLQHASAQDTTTYRCGAKVDSNQYSLAGFTTLCK